MRVLVCGSRTWDDSEMVYWVLGGLYLKGDPNRGPWMTVIEGGAKGADSHAAMWADCNQDKGVEHLQFKADWQQYGKRAGPARNAQMLYEGKPDLVVAFTEHPPTPGTQDMIRRAKRVGVPVWVVSHG